MKYDSYFAKYFLHKNLMNTWSSDLRNFARISGILSHRPISFKIISKIFERIFLFVPPAWPGYTR